ncbi:MAG TPA: cupredoxin family copper-binding protein, partial [Vicinamibacterales bacterium]|nr:cupredoxin family copper-binding protein [Vicinamibacterales bacterium]
IAMDGTSFAPAEMTVKVGDTVTWINKDPFPHNISSKAGGLHSGDLEPDASWQFHATTPGSFHYVCTLHPGMKGTLVVTP